MTKSLTGSNGKHVQPGGVKRVRIADGSYANTVRSDSSTLSRDLGAVFKSNVKKAIKNG